MELQSNNFADQLEFLNKLDTYVNDRAVRLSRMAAVDRYESEDTKDINAALAKAQGEFSPVGFNRENPFFKSGYADLANIVKSIRPALSKNGLSITQQTVVASEGNVVLVTKLRHASGQYIESRCRIIPPKSDAQSYGSTLTYMKRNSLVALVNVVIDADYNDDDAEVAMEPAREELYKGPSPINKYKSEDEPPRPISQAKLTELKVVLKEYPDIAGEILKGYGLMSLADIPESKADATIKRVKELTLSRNGQLNK